MERRLYRIILEGTIADGLDRRDVVRKLSGVFRKEAGAIEKLLSGKPRTIRKGIDLDTAEKYRSILVKAGATVHIEPEPSTIKMPVPSAVPSVPEVREREPGRECPRCGYAATRPDDVLIVRGDCPRCGYLVRKTELTPISTELERRSNLEMGEEALGIYGSREPASWRRRSLAAIYSFGIFLLVYWCIVLLLILVFFPPASIPSLIARSFVSVATSNFPLVLASVSICLVLFVFPLFRHGSTPGQEVFGIRMSFQGEGELPVLIMALALRALAVGIVSFVPGMLFLRMWNFFFMPLEHPVVAMVPVAGEAWTALAIHAYGTSDRRGILDVVAGSIQAEEGLLPSSPWTKALIPLAGACGFLVLVGMVLPYLFRS